MPAAHQPSAQPTPASSDSAAPKKAYWFKPLVFAVVLAGLIVLSITMNLGERLSELKDWIEDLGTLGPVVFIGLYIVATIAMVPGSALTASSGVLFGSLFGVAYVSVASTVAVALTYLIARYFARDAISAWLSKSERFKKIDEMGEEFGPIVVAILRLVPLVPFNVLNYGFGLTRIRFPHVVFWSWLCMLPGTTLYVVIGDALGQILESGEIPPVLIAVVAVDLAIIIALSLYAKRKIADRRALSVSTSSAKAISPEERTHAK